MSSKKNQYIPPTHFHPGETLAEKIEEMGMSSREFADYTGQPEKTINAVLNGESVITPDLAVQFESMTQIPTHFWLNSQRNYDEFVARENHKKSLRKSMPLPKRLVHTLQKV